jgi:hypothetical protein
VSCVDRGAVGPDDADRAARDERQRMHRQRIIIMVAGAAAMLGVLLPWMNAPLVGALPGTSAAHGLGWIALALAAVAVAGAIGRDAMAVPARLISGCAGAGAAGIAAWQIAAVFRARAEMRAEGSRSATRWLRRSTSARVPTSRWRPGS